MLSSPNLFPQSLLRILADSGQTKRKDSKIMTLKTSKNTKPALKTGLASNSIFYCVWWSEFYSLEPRSSPWTFTHTHIHQKIKMYLMQNWIHSAFLSFPLTNTEYRLSVVYQNTILGMLQQHGVTLSWKTKKKKKKSRKPPLIRGWGQRCHFS